MQMSLSEAIKNTRMKALLSQEEFAKELHVSVGTINRWEHGKSKPNIKAFCADNSLPYENIESPWLIARE